MITFGGVISPMETNISNDVIKTKEIVRFIQKYSIPSFDINELTFLDEKSQKHNYSSIMFASVLGADYVVKIPNYDKLHVFFPIETLIINEIYNNYKIISPYVAQVLGVTIKNKDVMIIIEKGIETFHMFLWRQVKKGEKFTFDVILRYALQICEGIAACHRQNIVHCDIKTDNIIYFPGDCFKLIDFGCSRNVNFGNDTLPCFATQQYSPPESFTEEGFGKYGFTYDVFSFGVILYQLLTLEFGVWNNEEMARKLVEKNKNIPFSMMNLPTQDQIKKSTNFDEFAKTEVHNRPKRKIKVVEDSQEITENSIVNLDSEFLPLVKLCEKCLAIDYNKRPRNCIVVLNELKQIKK
jgi:serine/threonine protein kinase